MKHTIQISLETHSLELLVKVAKFLSENAKEFGERFGFRGTIEHEGKVMAFGKQKENDDDDDDTHN